MDGVEDGARVSLVGVAERPTEGDVESETVPVLLVRSLTDSDAALTFPEALRLSSIDFVTVLERGSTVKEQLQLTEGEGVPDDSNECESECLVDAVAE